MQSENINELAAALAKAQGAIKGAVKGRENTYFKSTYADLPAAMEACRQALSENGIAIVQAPDFSDVGNVWSMWVETKLIHASGQWVSSRYPIRPTKEDPQGVGSAVTYARRYALMAMVGIVAEGEDDDAEGAMGRQTEIKPAAKKAPGAGSTAAAEAAKKWGEAAVKKLATMKSGADFDAWHTADVREKVAKLKEYDAALHASVMAAIDKTLDKLNPIGA